MTTSDLVPRILEALSVLTSPDSKAIETDIGDQNRFDFLLDRNLQSYHELLQNPKYIYVEQILGTVSIETETGPTRWRFVCCCLKMLLLLLKSIEDEVKKFEQTQKNKEQHELKPSQAPPLSPDTLSVRQQKTVMTAIQFIVILGILPNLDSGVGIPVERRSEFAKSLLTSGPKEESSHTQRHWRTFKCVEVLMQCLKVPSIGALVLSRHLNDVLVSLLQLVHSGPSETVKCPTVSSAPTNSGNIIQQSREIQKSVSISGHKQEEDLAATKNRTSVDSSLKDNHDTSSANWTPGSVVDMVTSTMVKQDTNQSEARLAKTRQEELDIVGEKELEHCNTWLQQLLDKVFPPMLVRELLLLQGGARPVKKNVSVNTGQKPLPASPAWLRRVCGRLLSDILIKPTGVINVLRGMLEGAAGTEAAGKLLESQTSDWRKCDAVAKVIACCPMQSTSVEEYYRLVAPQVLKLLHYPDKAVSRQFLRVACSTLAIMMKQQPVLTERYLLSPLMEPLARCCHKQDIHKEQRVIVEERELSLCIEDIHKVFVCGIGPGDGVTCLLPMCHVLFTLYSYIKKGVSHLRSACLEILVTVLKRCDKKESILCLQDLILGDCSLSGGTRKRMHPSVVFCPGDKGGIVVITRNINCEGSKEKDVAAVIDVLKELQKDGLTGDVFLFLLKELTVLISKEIQDTDNSPCQHSVPGGELLEAEGRAQADVNDFNRKIIILNLLAAICEEIGPSCLKDTPQILKFVQMTLERGVQVCKNTTEDVTQVFETETLTMAMGMLTAILTGTVKVSEEDRNNMKSLMPLLEEIGNNHHDNTVQEMASDLRVAIATNGVIWSDLLKMNQDLKKMKGQQTTEKNTKTSKSSKKPLVEIISETAEVPSDVFQADTKKQSNTGQGLVTEQDTGKKSVSRTQANSEITQDKTEPDVCVISAAENKGHCDKLTEDKTELQTALEDLQDSLLPVRGHGLISLTKLLKRKDPATLEKQEILLKIFKENLYHPDSYLYLAAVNGLVSLADRIPDEVLPLLTEQFLLPSSEQSAEDVNTRRSDNRVKVGECLVQVSRNLGDMSVKYRDLLLSTFLSGGRDKDSFVRASSLSNLGELCKVLKFSLGNFVQEILNCSCSLLKSDRCTEVRQAAGLMINLLLQGLGIDSLKVLDTVMQEVYRVLKQTMLTEKEDSVKVHVTLALNELDGIMRDVLFPKQTLQKRIRVLDPE